MSETCETCRFWRPNHIEPEEGWCHRNAPQPSPEMCVMNDVGDIFALARWPVTDDSDWCGEYQPKTTEASTPTDY